MKMPQIIQGGMGIGVSDWRLARAVSSNGQLGVVSGTAVDLLLARRLQDGDIDGHMRRAMAQFPIPEMAERILQDYFIEGGRDKNKPYKSKPVPTVEASKKLTELIVVANFVEVFLAKEGHSGLVGINLLEKIQIPTLPSLFGAMLAGVDYVLMGAGIPRAIPGALDKMSRLEPTDLPIDVEGGVAGETYQNHFDPREFVTEATTGVPRPMFLAIVTSASLATMLAKKASGKVDGFVVEGQSAGGHNAPPRGQLELTEKGEPLYGPRDIPDLEAFRKLEVPFWLAGSYGNREGLELALAEGAAGIQVGTAFAFCSDSGIEPSLKKAVIASGVAGETTVFTDPLASPTGFPFKVVQLDRTMSEAEAYESRNRVCDLGYLRDVYRTDTGTLGYRCSAEPQEDYVRKGGDSSDCEGRKCICNGLLATVGFAQVRKDGAVELPIITAGDEVYKVGEFLKPGANSYSAAEVIEHLLGV